MHSAVQDGIARNLADIGAVSLQDYLDARSTACLARPASETANNAITRLHQACQRVLRSTDALKFEFIEQPGSRNKQCILTIAKPDGSRRSYATQPTFAKKNEAKLEAARIAIDMDALDFLGAPAAMERPSAAPSDPMSPRSKPTADTCVQEIEKCCLEWRAGRVTPHWVQFCDPKSHKQGCALRIQLSTHVVRIYLCNPIFDAYSDAKEASAKAAISEAVLDFIKHGNGQSRPSSPDPWTPSTPQPTLPVTPWTLQAFYESLPRPFPESFSINDASGINAPGWLNTMVQNARGGKLVLSFFFTSDGPPGLHGCLLKLDRPDEYKASLVDARFTKRSDAKAAVCLQAMSEGIGDYIRSIATAVDTKVTSEMRSFSVTLVYPALISELSKIDIALVPQFEYEKERDAFGATLIIKLATTPLPEQIRRYTVPADYRNKADAKVAVICHAAEKGAVEFVRFRGGIPSDNYESPFVLRGYDPNASRKRKQPGFAEDAEQERPAKKRTRTKRNKRRERHQQSSRADGLVTAVAIPGGQRPGIQPSGGNQIQGISGPGDMGLSQSVFAGSLGDPSQPGVGSGAGSGGVAQFMGSSHGGRMHASSSLTYPAILDPRFVSAGSRAGGHDSYEMMDSYDGTTPSQLLPESGPSRAMPGSSSRPARRRVDDAELEPGEVVSSSESEFSESSSRNEECNDMRMNEGNKPVEGVDDAEMVMDARQGDKGKAKEVSPVSTAVSSRDGCDTATTITGIKSMVNIATTTSHVKKLIGYCATHGCGTPSFYEAEQQGRFQVWIVIGKERFDLPTTYGTAEEGRQRVAKQVLARMMTCKTMSG